MQFNINNDTQLPSSWNLLIVSNQSGACENATDSNTAHLDSIPGLRVYKIVVIVLPLINFVINTVSFCVFRSLLRRGGGGHSNDFHSILMYLAGSDAVFQLIFSCLHLLIFLMESNKLYAANLASAKVTGVCMIGMMFAVTVTHIARNWLVVLVSYYRHRTTTALRSGGRGCLMSPPVGPKIVAFLTVCCLVSAPRWMEFNLVACERTLQLTHIDGKLNNQFLYRLLYQGLLLPLAQSIGPLSLLAYFSAVLCIRVRRQNASVHRTKLTSAGAARRRHQQACTRLVAMLCLAFLLCETPTLAKALDPMRDRLQLLGYACNLLVCIDSSLNCFIYGCTNRQFGAALARRLRYCQPPMAAMAAAAAVPADYLDLPEGRGRRQQQQQQLLLRQRDTGLNGTTDRRMETDAALLNPTSVQPIMTGGAASSIMMMDSASC